MEYEEPLPQEDMVSRLCEVAFYIGQFSLNYFILSLLAPIFGYALWDPWVFSGIGGGLALTGQLVYTLREIWNGETLLHERAAGPFLPLPAGPGSQPARYSGRQESVQALRRAQRTAASARWRSGSRARSSPPKERLILETAHSARLLLE